MDGRQFVGRRRMLCQNIFPGHGDTHVDSHRDLPEVNKSRAELDALDSRL